MIEPVVHKKPGVMWTRFYDVWWTQQINFISFHLRFKMIFRVTVRLLRATGSVWCDPTDIKGSSVIIICRPLTHLCVWYGMRNLHSSLWNLRFSRPPLWVTPSSGMWRRIAKWQLKVQSTEFFLSLIVNKEINWHRLKNTYFLSVKYDTQNNTRKHQRKIAATLRRCLMCETKYLYLYIRIQSISFNCLSKYHIRALNHPAHKAFIGPGFATRSCLILLSLCCKGYNGRKVHCC
jgi:hypothetical protein